MAGIINDRFGERVAADPNDSSEDEKDKRRKLARGKP